MGLNLKFRDVAKTFQDAPNTYHGCVYLLKEERASRSMLSQVPKIRCLWRRRDFVFAFLLLLDVLMGTIVCIICEPPRGVAILGPININKCCTSLEPILQLRIVST